jgi:hypothetical protein
MIADARSPLVIFCASQRVPAKPKLCGGPSIRHFYPLQLYYL